MIKVKLEMTFIQLMKEKKWTYKEHQDVSAQQKVLWRLG